MEATCYWHRSKVIALSGVFLAVTSVFAGIVAMRDDVPFARPTIEELHSTVLDGASAYDQRSVRIEGFWCGPNEGFSIGSEVAGDSRSFILVRLGPDAFPTYKPSLLSHLSDWMRPDPTFVSDGNRVRVYGVYHGRGYQPPGYLLENCGWLEISRVESWDSHWRRWKRAAYWQ